MGIFQAGLLMPVAIGPVIGGALAGSLGWRAIFWFLTIYSAVFLVLLILLLPETLRSIVANGGRVPPNPIANAPLLVYQKTSKVKWTPEAESLQPAARSSARSTDTMLSPSRFRSATRLRWLMIPALGECRTGSSDENQRREDRTMDVGREAERKEAWIKARRTKRGHGH